MTYAQETCRYYCGLDLKPFSYNIHPIRWILGDFLCWLVFNMEWLSYWLTSIFTCCLSTSKLLVVRYPLSSQVFTRRYAHIACFIVWGLALISPPQILFMFFSDEGKLFFDYSMYLCMYDVLPAPGQTMPTFFYVVVVFVGIMQTIMFIVLPLTSILLVFEARRAARRLNERVRWQGVLTVTLCTGIYYVSTLPALLVAGIDSHKSITISVGVRRFCNFLTILNIMTNFFVYCLTVKSYREFLMIRAKRFLVKLGLMSFPSKPIRRVSRPASRTQSSEVDARASVQLTAM